MPKLTLLDMTQNILSAIDGDAVNSINDTVESAQVAEVIRETYYEIQAGLSVPSKEGLIQLDALQDLGRPNYLKIPENVKDIKWIKYNASDLGEAVYRDIHYLTPEQFLLRVTQTSNDSETVVVEDFNGGRFYIITDKDPSYWTTFDNEYIVFDSYNSSLDSTLQTSKSMCWGQYDPVFHLSDSTIPDLDADLFPLLLSEAKATCFINLKQVSSAKEEQRSRRQRVRMQNDTWKADQRRPYNRTPDYGRSRGRR